MDVLQSKSTNAELKEKKKRYEILKSHTEIRDGIKVEIFLSPRDYYVPIMKKETCRINKSLDEVSSDLLFNWNNDAIYC